MAGAAGRAFSITLGLLGEIVEVLLLALLLLAAGDAWREKLGEAVRSSERRQATLEVAAEMHAVVNRYLVVTAVINLGQGVVVAIVVWLLGLPSPIVWGALTFLAEFVPYLGGVVMIGLLLVAGLASGVGIGRALAAPGVYLVITSLQNNLVSPVAYGRGLRLNPAAVLVAVVFWWLLWGVAGAFLAVPILASIRVIAARVQVLKPVAVFLEG